MKNKAEFRQHLATLCCMSGAMVAGISTNLFTPLEDWLVGPESAVPMDRDQLSWLLSFVHISEMLSVYPAVFLADRWGRKACLLTTFPLMTISWLIIWLTRSFYFLLLARVFQGCILAIAYTVCPVYAAEIAEPRVRGRLGAFMTAMWNLGILFNYILGPLLTYEYYVLISCLPGLVFAVAFYQMPESPYFLLMIGEENAAEVSLSWFRGDDPVGTELKSIRVAVETDLQSSSSGWKDLFFSSQCRVPLFVTSIITLVRYLAGTFTTVGYLPETMGRISFQNPYWSTVSLAFVIFITCLLATVVTDTFGRRPALLWSLFAFAMANLTVALYSYLQEVYFVDLYNYKWVLYLGMTVILTAPRFGLVPVCDIIQAEYFPCHVRAAAGAYITALGALTLFGSMKIYQVLEDNYGTYSNFTLFAFFSFIGLFLITPIMRETANKSLGEIQEENRVTCDQNTRDSIYGI